MPSEVWFNELSHIEQVNEFDANKLVTDFIDALAAARRAGCANRLRLANNLFRMQVAPNYTIGHWISCTSDRNRRQLLTVWAANWPHLTYDEPEMHARALGYEFRLNDRRSIGVGLAWLFEGLAVSFAIAPFLDEKVEVMVDELQDDGTISSSFELVAHFSRPEHAETAVASVKNVRVAAVENGHDLWILRDELFPNLEFCHGVGEAVSLLGSNDPHFVAVRKVLVALDRLAAVWLEGEFPWDQFPHKVTPESGSTMQRYGEERTFESQDGSRIFSLHGRLTPGAWRYYVCETKVRNKLMVGYIGPKLSTVSDPT